MTIRKKCIILLISCIFLGSMQPLAAISRRTPKKEDKERTYQNFLLKSPSFALGGDIPRLFTCDGKDISPPLHWENPPLGTQSYVLILHDPDAMGGSWIHWIMINIPGAMSRLTQQVNAASINAKLAVNSWGEQSYGGPCPPLKKHRYNFTLYALDIPQITVDKRAKQKQVMRAMHGHILGKAKLMGKYQRPKSK